VSRANTGEILAVLLRNGNAGSNTVTDHVTVLRQAIAQVPAPPPTEDYLPRRRATGISETPNTTQHNDNNRSTTHATKIMKDLGRC
jgi:hypothetical protein